MLTEIQKHKLKYAAKTSVAVLVDDVLWHILACFEDEDAMTLTLAKMHLPRYSGDLSARIEDFDLVSLVEDHDDVTFYGSVALWDKKKMESNHAS